MHRALAEAMRCSLALVTVAALSSIVAAESRITIGASAGLFQHQQDAAAGIDATETLGLWGRLGLAKRVSAQLEITRHQSAAQLGPATDIRVFSGLVVVDLAERGRWAPTLLGGFGIDRDDGSLPAQGSHVEGGLGLEYRAEGGLTLGADVRLGLRSLADSSPTVPVDGVRFAGPATLRDGEYRAIRLTAGVRF